MAGVRENAKSLGPCLQAARSRQEVLPGKLRLVLSWTVLPSGAVSRPKLQGPRTVQNTSLPACFESKMEAWRFPPSDAPSKVRNFPLPVNLR